MCLAEALAVLPRKSETRIPEAVVVGVRRRLVWLFGFSARRGGQGLRHAVSSQKRQHKKKYLARHLISNT